MSSRATRSARTTSKRPARVHDHVARPPSASVPATVESSVVVDLEVPEQAVGSLRRFVAQAALNGGDRLPGRIAVVSAVGGEGVTTVTHELAVALASDADMTVCIVDASDPPGSGDDSAPGLVEVMDGDVALSDVIRPTSVSRVCVVHAGATSTKRSLLAASPTRLATLLDQLQARFGTILFDLPPVLESNVAIALVRHADAHVLVVRHGSTATTQIRAAAGALNPHPCLGVVLNRVRTKIPRFFRRFFVD